MSNTDHPLLLTLQEALEAERACLREGISEYQLIQKLTGAPYFIFEADALRDNLTLFQTHFLLFHCLYQIQQKWIHNAETLQINALSIKLIPVPDDTLSRLPVTASPLQNYYLNWDNFTGTQSEDVEAMLDDFWQKMAGAQDAVDENDIQAACETLAIDDTQWQEPARLKHQYRKLQHRHHPDKGGDTQYTQRLNQAYQVLLQANKKTTG